MKIEDAIKTAMEEALLGESVQILVGRPGDGKFTYLQDKLYSERIKYAYISMNSVLQLWLEDDLLVSDLIPNPIGKVKAYAGKDGLIIIDEVSEKDNILDIIKCFKGYRVIIMSNGTFEIKGAADMNITILHISEPENIKCNVIFTQQIGRTLDSSNKHGYTVLDIVDNIGE